MESVVTEYYKKRFGDNSYSAFIHLVREIGEIALAIEKDNSDHAKLKITESIALLQYLAYEYGLDVDKNIQSLYTQKINTLTKSVERKSNTAGL